MKNKGVVDMLVFYDEEKLKKKNEIKKKKWDPYIYHNIFLLWLRKKWKKN